MFRWVGAREKMGFAGVRSALLSGSSKSTCAAAISCLEVKREALTLRTGGFSCGEVL